MSNTEVSVRGFKIAKTLKVMKLRWWSLGFSMLIIIFGLVKFIGQGGFKLGIDFIGGTRVEAHIDGDIKIDDVRLIFEESGMDAEVTTVGNLTNVNYLITLSGEKGANQEFVIVITDKLKEKFGADKVDIRGSELIGSRMGSLFAQRSMRLMLIVTIMILIYVAIRFDFFYGAGAILALFHDILIVMVAIVLLDIRIDVTILAAILTILGYSINDSIVVFDRVRENHKINADEDYEYTMDKSITQSLSRTIITSLTTLMVAVSIYILGGRVLKGFGLALIVGVLSGTYSSIFVAAPITFMLKKKFSKDAHTKGKKKPQPEAKKDTSPAQV